MTPDDPTRTSMPSAAAAIAVVVAIGIFAAPHRTARAEQPSSEDDQKARELFRLGESHYAAGRYEKAAVLYDEAYSLSGRAALLLAMVNTYERMGDYTQAIERLRMYLKHPRAKNVASLRERVRRLEKAERDRAEERERLGRLEEREREREREREQELRPNDRDVSGDRSNADDGEDRGPSRTPAYLLLAGGAVGIGGAVVFGIASNRAGQDVGDQCVGGFCSASAEKAINRELGYAILADVSALAGIGAGAAGVYLLWKRREEPRAEPSALRIGPAFVPGGWGIGLA